ncbi:MAG: hypothetical protein PHH47_11195 [Gallionella sp.]|nr:hypothetical protein [Gallionella sp.]MDD4947006.1 hypothetical protein [Gallionella sp.]
MTSSDSRQTLLLSQLQTVRDIHAHHCLDSSRIDELFPLINHFD